MNYNLIDWKAVRASALAFIQDNRVALIVGFILGALVL
jgi:hypothetical protein